MLFYGEGYGNIIPEYNAVVKSENWEFNCIFARYFIHFNSCLSSENKYLRDVARSD